MYRQRNSRDDGCKSIGGFVRTCIRDGERVIATHFGIYTYMYAHTYVDPL